MMTNQITVYTNQSELTIDPSPCHNAVQSTHHNMEPAIEIFVEILDLAIVVGHIGARDPGPDELCRHLSFELVNQSEVSIVCVN